MSVSHVALLQVLDAARARSACNLSEAWQYWRESAINGVELGLVRGLDVALPVHFHPEDQITVVLSGKRRFVVGADVVEVVAGEGVTIPAGTPHRSLSDTAEVCCVNMYLPPGTYLAVDLSADGHRFKRVGYPEGRPDRGTSRVHQWETVCQAAHRAGKRREG